MRENWENIQLKSKDWLQNTLRNDESKKEQEQHEDIVKSYTKSLIGRKISKNVPKYSEN